jgi:hypothetical protein
MNNKPKVYVSKWDLLTKAWFWLRVAILVQATIAIVALLLTLAAGGRPQFIPYP